MRAPIRMPTASTALARIASGLAACALALPAVAIWQLHRFAGAAETPPPLGIYATLAAGLFADIACLWVALRLRRQLSAKPRAARTADSIPESAHVPLPASPDRRASRNARLLESTSDTLYTILNSATAHAILATDREMRITHINTAAADLLESTISDLTGRNLLDMQSRFRVDAARVGQVLRTVARQGRWETTVALPSRAGVERQIHCVITPMRDAAQQDVGYVLLAQDITEQVRARHELEAARKSAEDANRGKSAFVAATSHEIRTPMTAILGYVELLEEQGAQCTCPASTVLLDHLRTISRNARHLLSVVDSVLDLSKIDAGRLQTAVLRCNPAEILSDICALFEAQAARSGLAFNLRATTPLPETVLTDPTRLRQILFNIIGNALKFTARGGIRVDVALQKPADPSRHHLLEVDVQDTGAGMSAEQVARLFQPFSQAHPASHRAAGGSGLGLVLSRELARALGGDVEIVDSSPGRGTRMRITVDAGPLDGIAICAVDLPVQAPGSAPLGNSDNVGQPLANRRVLVVDDGPDNQRLIAHFLHRAGADVALADDGDEAVRKVLHAQPPFEAVVMDIKMPTLDGREATRLLRRCGCLVPILACTAHASTGEREACYRAGCDDYIAKPISRHVLVQRVAALIAGRRSVSGDCTTEQEMSVLG